MKSKENIKGSNSLIDSNLDQTYEETSDVVTDSDYDSEDYKLVNDNNQ